jgi:putative membrane protein (TIGR04086 family)
MYYSYELGHTMMITSLKVKKKGLILMNPTKQVRQARISSPLISGLVYSLILMAIGTILISLILFSTKTQESSLLLLTTIAHGISLFVGGWVSGKRAGNRGWYHGVMLGIVYVTILLIIGFLAYDTGINLTSLKLLTLFLAASTLGGMLGVNSQK